MISMKLDPDTWDIGLDAMGSIAATAEPDRVAQDAACAVRTFSEECIFDQDRGLPYFAAILGQRVPAQLVNAYVEREAVLVPGVDAAVSSITSVAGRTLTGEITITETTGALTNVAI